MHVLLVCLLISYLIAVCIIEMWREMWMEAAYFFVAHLLLCCFVPLFIIVVSYAFVGRSI